MPKIPEEMLLAFADELEKQADLAGTMATGLRSARSFLGSQGGAIGAGAGLGAAAGGLAGAGLGARRDYQQAREQGLSRGQAAIMGLGGAMKGVGKGATRGAMVGGGLGALSGARGQDLATRLSGMGGVGSALGAPARFGQRQLHGLTGWTPKEGLESIRAGTWGAQNRLDQAKEMWERASGSVGKVRAPGAAKGMAREVLDPKALKVREAARKEYELAQQHFNAVQDSVRHGMTNLPGMAKALAGPNRLEAIKAGVGAGWHGDTAKMKALNVAMPLAMGAGMVAMAPKEQRGETIGREALNTAAGLISPMTVMPTLAGQALSRGASAVGRTLGKGYDYARGRGRRSMAHLPVSSTSPGIEPQPGDVSSGPIERQYSNAALGKPPEGMGV